MVMSILLGNKRDNIFIKLKSSKIAVVWLLISWNYLYRYMQGWGKVQVKDLILIGIAGVVLVNCIYIPSRLMMSARVNSDIKLVFTMCFTFLLIINLRKSQVVSGNCFFERWISMIGISLVVTGVVAGIGKLLKVHSQKGKVSGKGKGYDQMDGYEFERYCARQLKEKGFHHIEVTPGSGDYGIDIVCYDGAGRKVGVQCKRYQGNVGWHAVEESRAGAEYWGCQRAVVLTNSKFTVQAIEGARRIGVELWDRDWFKLMK